MSTHRLNEVAAMLRGRKDHMDTDAASDVQAAATQIANLERTLATKELEVTKLREALFELRSRCGTIYRSREANTLACDVVSAINDAIMIISTPITTDALDSYVAEKVEDARSEERKRGTRLARDVFDNTRASGGEGSLYQQGWEAAAERIEDAIRECPNPTSPPLPAQPTEQPK